MSKVKAKERDEKADFDRWLAYTFTNLNTAPDVPDWLHKKLAEVYRFDRNESFLQKIKKMRRLKKVMFIDPVNYICTVLTARSLKTEVSANYGFIYSSDKKYASRISDTKLVKNPVLVSYCIAPSLVSTDGEYRNRLFRFGQFDIICERYPEIMEVLEKLMIHKIERYEISLECENFYPQMEHEYLAELIDHSLVDRAVQIKFFCIFWLVEIWNISINLQENHQNPKFNQIFFAHLDDDLREFRNLTKRFGAKLTEMLQYCTTPLMIRATDKAIYPVTHSVGQKLQPLKVLEVEEPMNIYFAPWREVYLSGLATDLLANIICPSFAIFVDWFYIKNSKKGLFDNEQQYQKIEYSERALTITKKLRETQRITYTRDPKTDDKVFLNGMFQSLYDRIDDPVDFAKAHLLMSNVTLGFIMENVGRTFVDIPTLIKSEKWVARCGNVMRDPWVFRKYCWDIQYGLLCLNVKLGVTHSDLHLNNCTINDLDPLVTDPKARVIYKIAGLWYAVRTHGPYACIIDFSRGTVHPQRVEKLPHWPNRESFEDFVEQQNRSMIGKLEQTVPTFMKINRDKVVELQRDNFDKFYRIYTAVDSYDFSSRVAKGFKGLARESVTLAEKIAKISEHYLTNIMLKVINNNDLEVDWPLQVILRECFTDEIFEIATPRDWTVTDMWIFDREEKENGKEKPACGGLPYTLDKFSCWPPILKTEYGMEEGAKDDSKKYRVTSVAHMDAMREQYEAYRKEQMKMVNYIARRHHEKYA
jgi:hypothetical protein